MSAAASPGPLLADRTTLRVGGPADEWITANSEDELVDAVLRCDRTGTPVLLVGGGSNLLVSDAGFPGTVIEIASTGADADVSDDRALLTLAAGETWDDVVSRAVARGWTGIEALSGIPGRAGATPVQNVGAYGQDVAQVAHAVRALDRHAGKVRNLTVDECGFGYRTSRFKSESSRWLVLSVTLGLGTSGMGVVRYAELADALGVQLGGPASVGAIRGAVLALRARKGMVVRADDPDTWSAGSFFTNPVVTDEVAAVLPAECPRYPAERGTKLSAAWLIEHAGVGRGFALAPDARAAISSKHTLALTNRGGASAEELVALAREVRGRVVEAFGITLVPEPVLVGVTL